MSDFNALLGAIMQELQSALTGIDPEAVADLRRDILQARRIFVAGRGRSGLQMQAFAMRLMHLDLDVHVVGSVTTPAIGAGDLLIIGSGSGRTDSIIAQARRASELNALVALITIAEESPVSKYADHILHIRASSPKLQDVQTESESVQPMGSLYEQSLGILCDVLTALLMQELGTDPGLMFARHANLE
ncbi:MAG: SIS domain-containing protein [Anaerolineaceae bacterium]|nr:SIS domain-containing protein [Anaerolineaceae bacterium]MCY4021836.1 SIS domain-containing protein [Anaerolineaceae bacterium]